MRVSVLTEAPAPASTRRPRRPPRGSASGWWTSTRLPPGPAVRVRRGLAHIRRRSRPARRAPALLRRPRREEPRRRPPCPVCALRRPGRQRGRAQAQPVRARAVYEERGYGWDKAAGNLSAEILGVAAHDAARLAGPERTIQVDATGKRPEETAGAVASALGRDGRDPRRAATGSTGCPLSPSAATWAGSFRRELSSVTARRASRRRPRPHPPTWHRLMMVFALGKSCLLGTATAACV